MDNYIINESDILSKLVIIEKHMGKCPAGFYEPSVDFRSSDEISVQKEASMMMKHVGLNHHVACITYTETKASTGGNVELDNSDNVFIDINKELKGQDTKVLAVMAHEICHKALFVHGLYYPNFTIENEILADLATIYVGFGKLSLNGCYSKTEEKSKEYNNGKVVETTKATTNSIGYLSLRQFAQAYNIVCSCNGTHAMMLIGLSPSAKDMVIRNSSNIQKPITANDLKQLLRSIQTDDATTTNFIKTIEGILFTIKNRIKDNQIRYKNDLVLPFKFDNGSDNIDNQMKAAETLAKYEIDQYNPDANKVIEILKRLIIDYKKLYETDDSKLLNIECPCCGYTKNNGIKEHKEVFVRCPSCGHYFLWNAKNNYTSEIEEEKTNTESTNDENESQTNNNLGENQHDTTSYSNTNSESVKDKWRSIKFILLFVFLFSFIPICVYINIPWIYKVMLVFPYSLLYLLYVKELLPNDYNTNFDVKDNYNGGDLKVGYNGVGETLMGKFGSGSTAFFSSFKGEYGAYRTYVFYTILFITIPINCLILKEDTRPEDDILNKRKYRVYGTSKWYILEVLWLYLRKYCYIASIIIVLYFLDFLWHYFK